MIYKRYEDTNFVTGDSPATHDVLTDLGHYANTGQFVNYGAGDVTIKVEGNREGLRSDLRDTVALASAEAFTIPAGTVFDFSELAMNIGKIQVIYGTVDTKYRIVVA